MIGIAQAQIYAMFFDLFIFFSTIGRAWVLHREGMRTFLDVLARDGRYSFIKRLFWLTIVLSDLLFWVLIMVHLPYPL